MSRAAALLLALLSLAPACKDREDPGATGTKVTAESDYDATQPIEDEAFRFRLVSPGPGWKLLRKQDMRRMLPDAVAGATSAGGIFGGVIVEKLPGMTLDKAVTLVSANVPQAVAEQEGEITFAGLPAHRAVFTAEIEGSSFRYLRILFLRDDYLYQVLTWGITSKAPLSALEPFPAAFSLTEGEIRGEVDDRPPVRVADGATWQIRDGKFQSVVSGLALEPSGTWRYLVGQELVQVNAEAELALTDSANSAYFAVISERYESGDPAGMVATIRSGLATNMGTPEEEKTRSVGGKAVPFLRYHTDTSLEFLVGVMTGDGAVTQVLTWYPAATRETSVPAFEALLTGMTVLSAAERDALREQLLARKGVVKQAAPTSAFLGEQFRDFQHEVTWTQPRGLYDVHLGEAARANSPNAVLSLQAPLEAVYAHLEVLENDGARVGFFHDSIAGSFEDRRDEQDIVDGVNVTRSFGHQSQGGVDFRYGTVSAAHGGHTVIMTAWGPATSPTVADSIDRVVRGVGFPARLPETTVKSGRFIDHHYGIGVEEPAGWARSDATPKEIGQGRFTQWKKGRGELGLLTVVSQGFSDEPEWMASFAEQTMRDLMANRIQLGKPESSAGTLDGYPSRRLVYPEAQLEITVRDSSLTMLIMANVDTDVADRFRQSLRWQHD